MDRDFMKNIFPILLDKLKTREHEHPLSDEESYSNLDSKIDNFSTMLGQSSLTSTAGLTQTFLMERRSGSHGMATDPSTGSTVTSISSQFVHYPGLMPKNLERLVQTKSETPVQTTAENPQGSLFRNTLDKPLSFNIERYEMLLANYGKNPVPKSDELARVYGTSVSRPDYNPPEDASTIFSHADIGSERCDMIKSERSLLNAYSKHIAAFDRFYATTSVEPQKRSRFSDKAPASTMCHEQEMESNLCEPVSSQSRVREVANDHYPSVYNSRDTAKNSLLSSLYGEVDDYSPLISNNTNSNLSLAQTSQRSDARRHISYPEGREGYHEVVNNISRNSREIENQTEGKYSSVSDRTESLGKSQVLQDRNKFVQKDSHSIQPLMSRELLKSLHYKPKCEGKSGNKEDYQSFPLSDDYTSSRPQREKQQSLTLAATFSRKDNFYSSRKQMGDDRHGESYVKCDDQKNVKNFSRQELQYQAEKEINIPPEILEKMSEKVPASLLMDVVKQLPSGLLQEAMKYIESEQGAKEGEKSKEQRNVWPQQVDSSRGSNDSSTGKPKKLGRVSRFEPSEAVSSLGKDMQINWKETADKPNFNFQQDLQRFVNCEKPRLSSEDIEFQKEMEKKWADNKKLHGNDFNAGHVPRLMDCTVRWKSEDVERSEIKELSYSNPEEESEEVKRIDFNVEQVPQPMKRDIRQKSVEVKRLEGQELNYSHPVPRTEFDKVEYITEGRGIYTNDGVLKSSLDAPVEETSMGLDKEKLLRLLKKCTERIAKGQDFKKSDVIDVPQVMEIEHKVDKERLNSEEKRNLKVKPLIDPSSYAEMSKKNVRTVEEQNSNIPSDTVRSLVPEMVQQDKGRHFYSKSEEKVFGERSLQRNLTSKVRERNLENRKGYSFSNDKVFEEKGRKVNLDQHGRRERGKLLEIGDSTKKERHLFETSIKTAEDLKDMEIDELLERYQKTLQALGKTYKPDSASSESNEILKSLSQRDSDLILYIQKRLGLAEIGGLAPTIIDTLGKVSRSLVSTSSGGVNIGEISKKTPINIKANAWPLLDMNFSKDPKFNRVHDHTNTAEIKNSNSYLSPPLKRQKHSQDNFSDILGDGLLPVPGFARDQLAILRRAELECGANDDSDQIGDGLLPNPYLRVPDRDLGARFSVPQDHPVPSNAGPNLGPRFTGNLATSFIGQNSAPLFIAPPPQNVFNQLIANNSRPVQGSNFRSQTDFITQNFQCNPNVGMSQNQRMASYNVPSLMDPSVRFLAPQSNVYMSNHRMPHFSR